MAPASTFFAGVDLGGTQVKIGLADGSGHLLSCEVLRTRDCGEAATLFDSVVGEIRALTGRSSGTLAAVGIGCPGRIDFRSGKVVWLKTKLEFLEGVSLAEQFSGMLGCPVVCDNDVNTLLAGEMRFGAGRGYDDVAALTIGTGVGGALVLGKRMVRGRNWATGHFGYMSHDPHGPRHVCGNTGIVEEHASHSGILRQLQIALGAGEKSSLTELLVRGNQPGLRGVFEAADSGDALGSRLAGRLICEIAVLIAKIVYALDPELILVGGGLVNHRPTFWMRSAGKHRNGWSSYHLMQLKSSRCRWGTPPACSAVWRWRWRVSGFRPRTVRRKAMTQQSTATQMPRWAESLMKKHGITEPPSPGEIPEWLRNEVAETPLWYIIREAREARAAHPYLLVEELRKQPTQWREILASMRSEIAALADVMVGRGRKEIIFTGCGSALFTAIHGEFVVERVAGIRCRAIESFELLHYFPRVNPARTVVIAPQALAAVSRPVSRSRKRATSAASPLP